MRALRQQIQAVVGAGLLIVAVCACTANDDDALTRAQRLLDKIILIDGHNDLPWAIRSDDKAAGDVALYDLRGSVPGQTDLRRLRAGRVGAQIWSVYTPGEAKSGLAATQLEQIELTRRLIERYPESLRFAGTAAEIRAARKAGRIASLLGMEGGHAIENSLGALRQLKVNGGVLMVTFVAGFIDPAVAAVMQPAIEEFNRRARAAGNEAEARRIRDEIFGALKVPASSIAKVADHIEHVRKIAGAAHVGIGGDFDGNTLWPEGLTDVSMYPNLFAELIRRGWSEAELRGLAGENLLRVMQQAETVARQPQETSEPSTARLPAPERIAAVEKGLAARMRRHQVAGVSIALEGSHRS